jgi:hypothetical protein
MSLQQSSRLALRNLLATVIKATAAPTGATLTAAGLLTRTDGGSFLTDRFSAGDEVLIGGFTGDNNGVAYITALPASTQLTLRLPEDTSRVWANQTSAGAISVVAGAPLGQADGNVKYVPTVGQPWWRESYKYGPETRQGLGQQQFRLRLQGLYQLGIFYPKNAGSHGLDGMTDAVSRVCSPGTELVYNTQKVTIYSCSPADGAQETEWASTLLSIRFQADMLVNSTVTP